MLFPLYLSILLAALITGLSNRHFFSVDLLYSLSINTPLGSFFQFLNRLSTSFLSLNLTFTGLVHKGLYFPMHSTVSIEVWPAFVFLSSSVFPVIMQAIAFTTPVFMSFISSYSDLRIPWKITFFSSS